MAPDPTVSVIMGTYNDENYITRSVESIFSQTYQDFEILIVDDASSDQTGEILEELKRKNSRLKVLTNEKNKGLTISLNRALEHSSGTYIARMDADDWCREDRLEIQVNFLEENTNFAMVGSFIHLYRQQQGTKELVTKPETYETIRKNLPWANPFCHGSVMIRSEVLNALGGYNESYRYSQDYELWSRLIPRYKARNLTEPLVTRRHHSEAVTSGLSNLPIRFSCDLGARHRALKQGDYQLLDAFSLAHPFINAAKTIYHSFV